MRPNLMAAAALLMAACASTASASTLSKVGGLLRFDGAPSNDCLLADGTRLQVAQDEVQSGVYQIWLEHRAATGELVGPALLITAGIVSWPELSCGVEGHSLVSWDDYEGHDPGRTFRLVASDHQSASEPRQSPPNAGSDDSGMQSWAARRGARPRQPAPTCRPGRGAHPFRSLAARVKSPIERVRLWLPSAASGA